MKKIIWACILILGTSQLNAQDVVYSKGDNLLNVGVGLGYYNYGLIGNSTFNLPAFTANYEIGIHEYFGVGPYVGFKRWSYRLNNGNNYGFNIFAFGARGSFHYTALANEALDLGIDESKWDFYVNLHVGLEIQSYSDNTALNGLTAFRFRPALGFRYYLSPGFGLYAEAGSGALSYLTLGATIKM